MIEPIFMFCFLFVAIRYIREEKRGIDMYYREKICVGQYWDTWVNYTRYITF